MLLLLQYLVKVILLMENSVAGRVIYTASADDSGDDVSGGVTFDLTSDSDSALSIDAQTGTLAAGRPDHEAQDQYSFTVVATDAAGNATEGQEAVTLTVNDLDDAAPSINSASTVAAIEAGSSAGEVIYTATADDSGDDVSDGVSFNLVGDRSDLSIDAATGAVTLNEAADASGYYFTVVATDAAGNQVALQDVSMAVYQSVSGQQPVDGSGDIQQSFTHNADGSITLQLTVDPSLASGYAGGVSSLNFELSYDSSDIVGGVITDDIDSSTASLFASNTDVSGTLAAELIYLDQLDVAAELPVMTATFNLANEGATFTVENIVMNGDEKSASASSVSVASGQGSSSDDVFMLSGRCMLMLIQVRVQIHLL